MIIDYTYDCYSNFHALLSLVLNFCAFSVPLTSVSELKFHQISDCFQRFV